MNAPFPFPSRTKGTSMILPDDQTLTPYKNQPARRFERTIKVPDNNGGSAQFDESAREISREKTEQIANLAPAKADYGWIPMTLAAIACFLCGWFCHLFSLHF